MVERFKINCYPLNRAIRVTITLPKNYNNSNRYYPVIYFLDGQNLYNDKESLSGYSLELNNHIERLENDNKEAIYIGVAAAMDENRRNQEYEGDILAKFIENELHDFMKNRYRMNKFIYSFGCGKACKTALTLGLSSSFKGTILISPEGNFLNLKIPKEPKLIYIYAGDNELEGICKKNLIHIKAQFPTCKYHYDDNDIHNESGWKKQVYSALNYLIL